MSTCLPEFKPLSKNESDILDEAKRQLIAYYLPPLIRMREWRLLFSLNVDGVSMQTFYSRVKKRDHTVLIIKDENGYIFGSYCCQAWH